MSFMHKQQIFDTVSSHLLAQGHTSFMRPGSTLCAYRGTDGSMCAAGRLIKDEHYCPALEGKRVTEERVKYALMASGINMNDPLISSMVTHLQTMHDTTIPHEWHKHLPAIAKQHGVHATVPAELPRQRNTMGWREEEMLSVSQVWVDEGSAIVDFSMAIMDKAYAAVSIAKAATHQLVPPDVTVEQWIARMPPLDVGPEDNPADDFEPDQDDSQPAPSVAHKQGVTA